MSVRPISPRAAPSIRAVHALVHDAVGAVLAAADSAGHDVILLVQETGVNIVVALSELATRELADRVLTAARSATALHLPDEDVNVRYTLLPAAAR